MANNDPRAPLHMQLRGKNLAFLATLSAILQLNKLPHNYSWRDIKRAVTPDAVRSIHAAVAYYWPNKEDLLRTLRAQKNQHSALYTGTYTLESLGRGINRHSLYSDSILIIDPFQHPNIVRPEFNPIENPEVQIASTLLALRIWWELAPWIDRGIVQVIRTPGDFDASLDIKTMTASRKRSEIPELRSLADEESENWQEHMPGFKEYFMLWEPDSHLEDSYRKKHPNASAEEIRDFLHMIQESRLDHPYFPDAIYQKRGKQMLVHSMGTNFDMALIVAETTGSHLITDLRYRWKEIEMDRESVGAKNIKWSAFAKAFDGLRLRFLDNIDIKATLRLREEGRLEGMRGFLRRVWNQVDADDDFSEGNVDDLSAELIEKVNEAEQEWKNIDTDLIKLAGAEAAALIAGGTAIGSGKAAWLAACIVGATNVVTSSLQRRNFPAKYPASFFIGK